MQAVRTLAMLALPAVAHGGVLNMLEPHPINGWKEYPHYDAPELSDWNEETHLLGGPYSQATKSDYPRGPPPLECYDICYEDPQCHGFVLWQQQCYFRGGKTQGPLHLLRIKEARDDMSLFILYGAHPVAPIAGTNAYLLNLLVYVGGGVAALILASFLMACFRSKKCGGEQPVLPKIVPQSSGNGLQGLDDIRKGCVNDLWCAGSRKKAPPVALV